MSSAVGIVGSSGAVQPMAHPLERHGGPQHPIHDRVQEDAQVVTR